MSGLGHGMTPRPALQEFPTLSTHPIARGLNKPGPITAGFG
jgi:hypothetical protein